MSERREPKLSGAPRGFTLIEVTMATLIAGLLLVTAMNTLGSSTRSQRHNAQRAQAALLGAALLNEIMALPYSDPEGGTGLGRDTGEGSSDRADFDDVDDYLFWSDSPIEDKQGNTLASGAGMSRLVWVLYADPDDLDYLTVSTPTGVKRIWVRVIDSAGTEHWHTGLVTEH